MAAEAEPPRTPGNEPPHSAAEEARRVLRDHAEEARSGIGDMLIAETRRIEQELAERQRQELRGEAEDAVKRIRREGETVRVKLQADAETAGQEIETRGVEWIRDRVTVAIREERDSAKTEVDREITELARTRVEAELTPALAMLTKTADGEIARINEASSRSSAEIARKLIDQEKVSLDKLSAKAVRRDRKLERDDRRKISIEAREAAEAARQATIEAEQRITMTRDEALGALGGAALEQREIAARQLSEAQRQLANATLNAQLSADNRVNERISRLLDGLLGDIKAIGNQLGDNGEGAASPG